MDVSVLKTRLNTSSGYPVHWGALTRMQCRGLYAVSLVFEALLSILHLK